MAVVTATTSVIIVIKSTPFNQFAQVWKIAHLNVDPLVRKRFEMCVLSPVCSSRPHNSTWKTFAFAIIHCESAWHSFSFFLLTATICWLIIPCLFIVCESVEELLLLLFFFFDSFSTIKICPVHNFYTNNVTIWSENQQYQGYRENETKKKFTQKHARIDVNKLSVLSLQ